MKMVWQLAWVFIIFVLTVCDRAGNIRVLSTQTTSSNMNEPGQSTPLSFLALGDSYTIGETVAPEERWPVVLADRLTNADLPVQTPKIIATTGWTTGELKKAIEEANLQGKYDLVSLLIGVNNQYRGYKTELYEKEFKELLDTAIEFAGNRTSRVFVVSIPDYAVTPFGKKKDPEKITREIDLYNKINKRLSEQSGVIYFDITGISRQAAQDQELVAGDGLHPSGKMYGQWVDHIYHRVRMMIE